MRSALPALVAVAVILPATTVAQSQSKPLAMAHDSIREVRISSPQATVTEPAPPPGMVFIPGGQVVMGTELSAIEMLGDGNDEKIAEFMAETPRHTQSTEAFFLDRNEVTNLQWRVYLEATGRQPGAELAHYYWVGGKIPEGQEFHPVAFVSFGDVSEFMAWSGRRLPTEAEWTMAARGPADSRDYPWGPKWDAKNCRSQADTPSGPIPVGSHPEGASPFGVLDMSGNLWELVDSSYSAFEGFKPWSEEKGRRSRTISPEFNRSARVAKGGSFFNSKFSLRIDYRLKIDPSSNNEALGFRSARSIDPGVDVATHGHRRLMPAAIPSLAGLDLTDVVAKEATVYNGNGQIITGHRWLAFAHPVAKKGVGLTSMRKDAREEPVTLGLLTTSEALAKPALPPGDYLLAYKGEGESKAHREKRMDEKRNGGGKKDKDDATDAPPAEGSEGAPSGTPSGASAPWPGVGAAGMVEDIDFPQDAEVILFYNMNNAVVGYTLLPEAQETDQAPATLTCNDGDGPTDDGKRWTIAFSLDNMPRNKKMPRFTIELELQGDGLKD